MRGNHDDEGSTMNKMMRRLAAAALWAAVTAAAPVALGQADAAAAYQQGKTAYAAGEFDKARELFAQASRTDTKNPEVFLWLGKAEYQLGHVNEAVTAWKTTLQLAPNEPYAAGMVQALQGDSRDADSALAVIDALVKQGLAEPALARVDRVLADKALTQGQRPRALLLRGGALLEAGRPGDVEAVAQELLIKYPNAIDAEQVALLRAKAKLRLPEGAAEGVAMLKQLAAEHPDSSAGVAAAYELLAFDLAQGPTADKADALAKWLAAHGDHPMANKARAALVEADLAVTERTVEPTATSELTKYDQAALATSAELYPRLVRADEAAKLTQRILAHFQAVYANHRSYAVAIAGTQGLLKAPLPPSSREVALRTLAGFQVEAALREITAQAEAGKLAGGAMPKPLADAAQTLATLTKEFPGEAAWKQRANLAERLHAIATTVPWPTAKVTAPKAVDAWAVEIALPVAKSAAEGPAVDAAIKVVTAIVNDLAGLNQPAARAAALKVNADLLAALAAENPSWVAVAQAQASLLAAQASSEFQENVRTGKLDANAKLSTTQEQLIAALATLVGREAKQAPWAIDRLRESLQPWLGASYHDVAEAAYAKLTAAVPEAQQRQVKLAIVQLWVQKAFTDAQRLAAAGLAEPRKLDPSLAKALQSLYAMQAGLDADDSFLAPVRQEIDRIVGHYKAIRYYDVAEAAIKEKPQQANVTADAYVQFELAVLADESARREIEALLKQYKATEKLSLTDAMKAAIAAYEKFITDHPTDPLAATAVDRVFAIASSFEQYAAYDVAIGIDRDFATFAAKNAVLSQATPGSSSVAERATFAAVTVLDVKARDAMTKSVAKSAAENKGTPKPPEKLSDEFTAAIAAYKEFIKTSPDSPLVAQALLRIGAIALDYARADAWDVADAIYGQLLTEKLATLDPERIEFCRGLCQVGKVMPEHAKEVLAALLSTRHGAADYSGFRGNVAEAREGMEKRLEEAGAAEKPKSMDQKGVFGGGGGGFGGNATGFGVQSRTPPPTAAPVASTPSGAPAGVADEITRGVAPADDRAKADNEALAAISRQEARRASQVAMMRDTSLGGRLSVANGTVALNQPAQQQQGQMKDAEAQASVPVLSPEELARQQAALDAAYKIFQQILKDHPHTATADQARGEIMVEIGYWRGIAQPQRAASFGERFLADNPADKELPKLRLAIATDHLAWAAQPLNKRTTTQEMLAEVTKRFVAAREELAKVAADFPDERPLVEDAQWQIATSSLTQARTVDSFSATLARGQYVRAAKELRRLAGEFATNPQIAQVPQMLWDISTELHNRGYHDDALTVWNILAIDYPTLPQAQQALLMTAQTYQASLGRPLRAAEVYLEINSVHGGADASMQDAVFAIGADLKNQKRWIEAQRVLESFVQSFPKHPRAGEALTMIGQIHQANEAWQEAIAAYRRVIDEFPASGQWMQDAKWSIADATINLSQWKEAIGAYESYVASFPKDGKVAEANRRIGVLKDLANYQKLVDENGPKAYDAQFQIASIVNGQLGNWRKAVQEYQKVATNWPKSHLAADALHSIGLLYLQNGEVDEARSALRAVASNYPDSPYACDSLYQIGKSYEDEANRLSTVTRQVTFEANKEVAQRRAYTLGNTARAESFNRLNSKAQELKKAGQKAEADLQIAVNGGALTQNDDANFTIAADNAFREQEQLTAGQLADRQDKINAALRRAVTAYAEAAKVPAGDKAGESLLHMAVIYNDRLGDSPQAMATWLEIVRQFSGTAVAEEASWQIAQHYEKAGQYAEAVEAYKSFLRNYRRSPKAADAQFFIAENYEHLGQWIAAMDQYTNYVQNFPEGTLVQKAREQISFIKTYRL
jgi:TolA-binding protein